MNETAVKKAPNRNLRLGISFFLIFSLLLALCSWILYPRDNTKQSGIAHPEAMGFTSLPDDRVDVVAIGNSNAYSGFSPMELWGNYGYAAYVSGEPRQQMASAVTLLEKYYQTQQPKVVILETDEVFTGNNHVSAVALGRLENFFPIVKYHNNWKTIRLSTLLRRPQHSYLSPMMGQSVSSAVRGYEGGDYMKPCGQKTEIPAAARLYLDKFKTVCQEHNTQLLLVSFPCAKTWSAARHDAMTAYAKENGLTYIDLNENCGSYGFNWKTDTGDAGTHLNASGARKVTACLGSYLKANCGLTDRRGSADWSLWQKSYQQYEKDNGAA